MTRMTIFKDNLWSSQDNSFEKSDSPRRYLDGWDLSSSTSTNTRHQVIEDRDYTMEIVVAVFCVFGLIVVCCLLCACCRKSRNRGQVLAPPPAIDSSVPAPYPQQQYTIAAYPVTHTTALQTAAPYPAAPYPTNTGACPMPTANANMTGGAPYPTGGAPYPTGGAPYPTTGAPYPTAGAPYPTGGTPYPTGVAPYPTGGAPYPTSGPTAPNVNALPPTYDQAMGGIEKQLPYNPNAPH